MNHFFFIDFKAAFEHQKRSPYQEGLIRPFGTKRCFPYWGFSLCGLFNIMLEKVVRAVKLNRQDTSFNESVQLRLLRTIGLKVIGIGEKQLDYCELESKTYTICLYVPRLIAKINLSFNVVL